MTTQELNDICVQVRRDILRMTYEAQSGHPGGSLGCVEFFTALYFKILNHDPKKFSMDGVNEDLFFLSNGHISPVWYSVLARAGYFGIKELSTFRKLGSQLQGHPTNDKKLNGIRIASGSLGQGLSASIGAALTKKLNNDKSIVYCLTGDGELQEGQIWEAAMFAAAKKVDNIIVTVDYNKKQIDGPTDDVCSLGNVKEKWKAFGWNVIEVENGNNIECVISALTEAKLQTNKGIPVVILLKTIMGKGVDFMENNHKWHGTPPNKEQFEKAIAQLKETVGDY
ncbi:MAG: transketolase [Bacteroidales bacterium]|nr:transketolase [Bacteroidales bacterium]